MCPTKESNKELLVSSSNSDESVTTTTDERTVFKKSFLLPVFVFVAIPPAFVATYVIAVLSGHVSPVIPYISDTGSLPPESCIFAQVLNIVSFLLLVTVYLRYLQVREFARLRPSRALRLRFNSVTAGFGAASCVGLNVLANFQESNVLSVHMIGAAACFAFGNIYFIMQTLYSRQMSPEINSMLTVYVRAVLSALCVIFTLSTMIPVGISVKQFKKNFMISNDRRHWGPEDGGYAAHLTSTVSEWFLVLSYILFVLSCVKESMQVHVYSPQVVLLNVEPESSLKNNNGNTISKMV